MLQSITKLYRNLQMGYFFASDYIGRHYNIPSLLYPLQISYAATKLCNSKCIMCNIWMTKDNSTDLKLQEIEKLAQQKYFRRVMFLGITGGEPFLRGDLPQIVQTFAKHLPHLRQISFSTNGYLTNRIEKGIKEMLDTTQCNLDVTISVDGMEEMHDKIRRIPNGFKMINKTISIIKKYQEQYGKKRVSLRIRFTMLPQNYKELVGLYNHTQQQGIKFTSKPGTAGGLYDNNEEFKDWNAQYTPEQKEEAIKLITQLVELENEKLDLRGKSFLQKINDISYLLFLKYSIEFVRDPQKLVFPCFATFSSVFLEADGSVHSCPVLYKKIGNVRDQEGFDGIWHSEAMEKTRTLVKKCPTPCYTNCNMIPSLVFEKVPEIFTAMAQKKIKV